MQVYQKTKFKKIQNHSSSCLAPTTNGAREPNAGPTPELLLIAAITGHEHFVGLRGGEREHHGVEELRTADGLRTIRVLANSVKSVFLDNFIIQLTVIIFIQVLNV